MSEKDNNLTPWQQKHLEYQKRKAEEAKKEKKANQPKKARLSSPFLKSLPKTEKNFDDTEGQAESAELLEENLEVNQEESQSSEYSTENVGRGRGRGGRRKDLKDSTCQVKLRSGS